MCNSRASSDNVVQQTIKTTHLGTNDIFLTCQLNNSDVKLELCFKDDHLIVCFLIHNSDNEMMLFFFFVDCLKLNACAEFCHRFHTNLFIIHKVIFSFLFYTLKNNSSNLNFASVSVHPILNLQKFSLNEVRESCKNKLKTCICETKCLSICRWKDANLM